MKNSIRLTGLFALLTLIPVWGMKNIKTERFENTSSKNSSNSSPDEEENKALKNPLEDFEIQSLIAYIVAHSSFAYGGKEFLYPFIDQLKDCYKSGQNAGENCKKGLFYLDKLAETIEKGRTDFPCNSSAKIVYSQKLRELRESILSNNIHKITE